MEVFDIVDEEGLPTGETVPREKAHAEGIRHRTAHIWVVRRKPRYEILLQKRAMGKDSFPGRYDTSSAGHIHAGDEPRMSAVREIGEELGIHASPEDLTYIGKFSIDFQQNFHGKPFLDSEIAFVYVYEKPVELKDLTLQKEEVEGAGWFDLEQTLEAVRKGDPLYCVPEGGLKLLLSYLRRTEKAC